MTGWSWALLVDIDYEPTPNQVFSTEARLIDLITPPFDNLLRVVLEVDVVDLL